MNRPTGATAAVILLTFGSLFCLAMGAIMAWVFLTMPIPEAAQGPRLPEWFFFFPTAMFGGIAVWGLATAIGVWRMRRWGRISLLIFSVMLVVFNGMGLLMMVLLPILFPEVRGETGSVMWMVVAFYSMPVLAGVWWLIYFNRGSVKELFLAAGPVPTGPECPLSVTVIAWHFLIAAPMMILGAWFQWPAMLFGFFLMGWKASLVCLLWGGAGLYIGLGLLRLRPQSLMYAVYYFLFGATNATIFYLQPDSTSKLRQLMEQMKWAQMPGMETEPVWPPAWISILLVLLTCALPVWYLLTRKERYLAAGAAKRSGNTAVTPSA